jgi:subtilisin family serine protease
MHPKIKHAMEQLRAGSKGEGRRQEKWGWRDFEGEEKGKTLRTLHGRSFNTSSSSPSLTYHSVSFSLTLSPHPLSKHEAKHIVQGGEEKEQRYEREASEETEGVINQWISHLTSPSFLSTSSSSGLCSHLTGEEAKWIGENRIKAGWERYDARSYQSADYSTSPSSLHFLLLSPTHLHLTCSSLLLPSLLSYLSSRSEISWIEPAPSMKLHNKFTHSIVQSSSNLTSVWSHSLLGAGEIIQLGDTGLDSDSCFFKDQQRQVPVNSVDLLHRKIVTYTLFDNADHGDDVDGHGTHVGGSLVGSVENADSPLREWGGMAPQAKVAFYDFKRSGQDDLLVPLSVYKPYLSHAYSLGARISSNSWGSPDGEYGSYCRELDQFAGDWEDFLILFAAGNYGETGWNTVSSPGVSKNVLTVGSTKTSARAFFEAGMDWGLKVEGSGEGILDEHPGVSVAEANFGLKFSSLSLPSSLAFIADPIEACEKLRIKEEDQGKQIVIVRRGTCHFGEKTLNVQSSSSSLLLLLVVNNEDGPPAHMAADEGQESIVWTVSAVMIGKAVGESIISSLLAQSLLPLANQTLRISAPIEVDPPNENESVLSSFSSRGPTFGGRLKPDLLAPGEFVRSVRSDGSLFSLDSCPSDLEKALLQLEGTSMATPMVAGSAALVREYLKKGFYPSGVANASDSFPRPRSSLIKALLMHSALSASGMVLTKRLTDAVARVENVEGAPSYYQGFGRILLDLVMRFAPKEGEEVFSEHSPLMTEQMPNIAVIDDQPALESEVVHSYCFLVSPPPPSFNSSPSLPSSSFPPFRATLVWTDPPVSEGAAFVLVNNLDLFVSFPSLQRVYIGNGFSFTDTAGTHPQWDFENNVEQVSVKEIPVSENEDATDLKSKLTPVLVHVRGTSVPEGLQRYSLVVTGWFEDWISNSTQGNSTEGGEGRRMKQRPIGDCLQHGEDHLLLLCPSSCLSALGFGNCSYTTGLCSCSAERTGSDCSIECVEMRKEGRLGADFEWRTPGSKSEQELDRLLVPSEGWLYFSFSLLDFHATVEELLKALESVDALRITMTRTSTIGDPDLFVSTSSYPSLRLHDFADTQCDSCVATGDDDGTGSGTDTTATAVVAKPSQVDLTKEKLVAIAESLRADPTQRVRIGVHGYCCDASEVTLSISPVRPRPPLSYWYWLAPLLVVVLLLVFIFLYARRRHRRTEQGLDLMPLPSTATGVPHGEVEFTPSSMIGRPDSPSRSEPSHRSPPIRPSSNVRGFMPLAKEEHESNDERHQPHSAVTQ